MDQSDSCRVQYLSTWVDEEALVEYAGDDWRSQAVTFPDEEKFLRKPLSLRHYSSLTIEAVHDGTLA